MMSNKKITRLRLEDAREDDFYILGLVSSEPDYKLSLIINRKLKISLKNSTPVTPDSPEGADFSFSRFSSSNGTGSTIDLISNRHNKTYLIKSLKNIDFILLVFDPEGETAAEKMSSELRGIDDITAVFIIDRNALKDKNLQYLIG